MKILRPEVCEQPPLLRHPLSAIMPGVYWGRADVLYTPAFWKARAADWTYAASTGSTRLGSSLAEEVAACILGGYGIPAEIGLAAYERLRAQGLLADDCPTAEAIAASLRAPLAVGRRSVRYRFVQQRSLRLAEALRALAAKSPPTDSARSFRDFLMTLPGIGPKTASWITRNWLNSDEVAIIDIHIYRAGIIAGFFSIDNDIQRDYTDMEAQFLEFASRLEVRASVLDAVMWQQMRASNGLAIQAVRGKSEKAMTIPRRRVA